MLTRFQVKPTVSVFNLSLIHVHKCGLNDAAVTLTLDLQNWFILESRWTFVQGLKKVPENVVGKLHLKEYLDVRSHTRQTDNLKT